MTSESSSTKRIINHLVNCSTRLGLSSLNEHDQIRFTLQSYLSAGARARVMNDDAKAERLYHETIKMAIKEFDEVIPELATARYLLSILYYDTAELMASEIFAMSALGLFTELYGATHPATRLAMDHLADVRLAFNVRKVTVRRDLLPLECNADCEESVKQVVTNDAAIGVSTHWNALCSMHHAGH